MQPTHATVLTINLEHLRHNYKVLRAASPDAKFMGVVKAGAYGSDMIRVALELQELGADYLAVAYAHEGTALRDAGIRLPILVLHAQPHNYPAIIERCLEPALYNASTLAQFLQVAADHRQTHYPVHIKWDTGLNRLGFKISQMDEVLAMLTDVPQIRVASTFSHLAASEDKVEDEFTGTQIDAFAKAYTALEQHLGYEILAHCTNTSGLLRFPKAQFSMVRAGIGLYGYGNTEQLDRKLKPVTSLTSIVSHVNHIAAGESIGYNRSETAQEDMHIGVIPMGHADGLLRSMGQGRGGVWIADTWCPIMGNVCMDMIMVAVPSTTQPGDAVVFFNEEHPATHLAHEVSSISYEILTSLNARISRVYV